MIAVAVSFAISVLLGVSGAVLAVQAVVLAAVSLFIQTRPDGTGNRALTRAAGSRQMAAI
jgi:hypothetical protein